MCVPVSVSVKWFDIELSWRAIHQKCWNVGSGKYCVMFYIQNEGRRFEIQSHTGIFQFNFNLIGAERFWWMRPFSALLVSLNTSIPFSSDFSNNFLEIFALCHSVVLQFLQKCTQNDDGILNEVHPSSEVNKIEKCAAIEKEKGIETESNSSHYTWHSQRTFQFVLSCVFLFYLSCWQWR